MKKILSLLLALILLCSLSVTAFAEENPSGTQTLMPDKEAPASPTWELVIPANVTVSGPGDTNIGQVEITNVVANGSTDIIYVHVTETSPFTSGSGTIPFTLYRFVGGERDEIKANNYEFVATCSMDGFSESYPLSVTIEQADYDAAPYGTYTATITYASFSR